MSITTDLESIESLDLKAVTGGCKKGGMPPPQQQSAQQGAPPPSYSQGGDQVSISVNGQTQTTTG